MNKQVKVKGAVKCRRFFTDEDLWGFLFIGMAVIVFILFTLYPVINALKTSFYHYKPLKSQFAGFANYVDSFKSKLFFKAIGNTVLYTVFTVPLSLLLAFVVSVLILPFNRFTQSVFKSLYYLPAVASGVALSVVWLWIYDSLPGGLLNQALTCIGCPIRNWLGSSATAMGCLIVMAILSGQGTSIIIYMAALLGISDEYYEAAALDGANFCQKLWYIVIPLVKPTTLFLAVTGIIGSFQVFLNAYMMTGGGPNNNTTMIGLLIYNNAFKYNDFGLACAQAVMLAVIIAAISLFQFKIMGDDVKY